MTASDGTSAQRRRRARRRIGTEAAGRARAAIEFEREREQLFARYGFDALSHRVADQEGRVTYLLEGGTGDPPTVLVHGGLSHAGEWAPLAGRLGGRVIVPDRPGCGLSHPVDYRHAAIRTSAIEWVRGLLDAIDAPQADLVGNSMGGYFSVVFALAHPERVRRIVLVGAPAGVDRSVPMFLRLWGNPLIGPLIRRLPIRDPEQLRKRVYGPLLVAHPEDVATEILELDLANGELPGVESSAYSLLRAATTLRGVRKRLIVRDELAQLDVPVLMLWGASDAFAGPASGEDLAARMPSGSIDVLADTGHLPHLERPEAIAAAIAGFLASDARDAGSARTPSERKRV